MPDDLSSDLASLRISREERVGRSGGGALKSLAVAALALVVVGGAASAALPAIQARIFKTEIETTEVVRISPSQAAVDLTSTGYVVAQTVAKVGAKLVGRVTKSNVKEGERVNAGAVLFELDTSDERATVAAAEAKVAAARARAEVARANVAEVEEQLTRESRLLEGGAVGQATVDDLKARMRVLAQTARAADADVAAAQAEAGAARVVLKSATIEAPIAGTIVDKPAQVGDVVGPTGAPVAELADFSTLLVETDVPEARLALVKPGAPCEVVLDAFPDKRLRGAVVEVSPRLNRAKATATVKVKLVDAAAFVLPEMAARVSFLAKPLDDAAMKAPPKNVVAASAVVDRGGRKVVFVVDGGKVRMTNVTLGESTGSGVELREGPAPGARLVKNPPASLKDGDAIKEKSSS